MVIHERITAKRLKRLILEALLAVFMAIRIFVTGGTFDKEYNELNGSLFFRETHIRELLKLGRCDVEVRIEKLMMKDSLDMSQSDREIIARKCRNAKEDMIIVTHGTDTLVETAKVIAGSVKGKTIVLTGAMIPYSFGSSDGLFNLGAAIAYANSLVPGVYVAMNGKRFNWNNVHKNKKIGRFEHLKEYKGVHNQFKVIR